MPVPSKASSPPSAVPGKAIANPSPAAPAQGDANDRPPLQGFRLVWREYLRPFLIVALVLTAARSSLLDWNDVPTGSMKPSIVEGDRIFVNKLAYDLKVPYLWAGNNMGWLATLVTVLVIAVAIIAVTRLVTFRVKGEWPWGAGIVLAIVFALKFTTEIDTFWTAQLDHHNYSVHQVAKWGDPKAGDIVVFYSPFDGTRLVKRVVGVPGDTIELRTNRLYINGVAASYGSLEAEIYSPMSDLEKRVSKFQREKIGGVDHPVRWRTDAVMQFSSYGPVKVPEGHYFMMGDNRDESKDSRFPPDDPDSRLRGPGMVPRENIVGRAGRIAVSVDPSNYYMPRWSRIFRALP